MLWFMLLVCTLLLHAIRWGCYGSPRYPLQHVSRRLQHASEAAELILGVMLLMAFVVATAHERVRALRLLCFAITLLYHLLVTLWARVWWRNRSWNSLVVLCYGSCLWWLVLLYMDVGIIPMGLVMGCAIYKSLDIYLVYNV